MKQLLPIEETALLETNRLNLNQAFLIFHNFQKRFTKTLFYKQHTNDSKTKPMKIFQISS